MTSSLVSHRLPSCMQLSEFVMINEMEMIELKHYMLLTLFLFIFKQIDNLHSLENFFDTNFLYNEDEKLGPNETHGQKRIWC